MSAWAVFSMMGVYPDCPGVPKYTFTTPTFDKIEIAGKLTITKTPGRRIASIRAGGRKVGYRIDHDALAGAGTIEFKCK